MQAARRGDELDFSNVRPRQEIAIYRRTKSGTSPEIVRQSQRRLFEGRKPVDELVAFTPPKYDEQFFTAIATLQDETG